MEVVKRSLFWTPLMTRKAIHFLTYPASCQGENVNWFLTLTHDKSTILYIYWIKHGDPFFAERLYFTSSSRSWRGYLARSLFNRCLIVMEDWFFSINLKGKGRAIRIGRVNVEKFIDPEIHGRIVRISGISLKFMDKFVPRWIFLILRYPPKFP